MNVATVGRSTGCLKVALRRTRFQRAYQRSMSTTPRLLADLPNPSPEATGPGALSRGHRADLEKLSKYKIWPQVPSAKKAFSNPMPAIDAASITKLDPTGARTRMFSKVPDAAKPGDVLMVTTKGGEPFAGAFMQIRRQGVDTAIQLRGQLMKTSVEMWFKVYSPTVTAIDVIWRKTKRAKRARLTYLRKAKHDMGSVDKMVFAWRKERYALRSKEKRKVGKV